VNTVPEKCPFCESPILIHGGNPLRSEDGGFATYECKTEQDVGWPDDQWKRTGQKERCRRREVQLLTKQRDEARGRIKRLEDCIETAWGIIANVSDGDWTRQKTHWQEAVVRWRDNDFHPIMKELSERKAKEAKL
jgi:hypothetical protein